MQNTVSLPVIRPIVFCNLLKFRPTYPQTCDPKLNPIQWNLSRSKAGVCSINV